MYNTFSTTDVDFALTGITVPYTEGLLFSVEVMCYDLCVNGRIYSRGKQTCLDPPGKKVERSIATSTCFVQCPLHFHLKA